jgi:hypothetical protein
MRRTKINQEIRAEAERLIREPRMKSKKKKKSENAEVDDILYGRCHAALVRRFPDAPMEIVGRILMQTIHESYLR